MVNLPGPEGGAVVAATIVIPPVEPIDAVEVTSPSILVEPVPVITFVFVPPVNINPFATLLVIAPVTSPAFVVNLPDVIFMPPVD